MCIVTAYLEWLSYHSTAGRKGFMFYSHVISNNFFAAHMVLENLRASMLQNCKWLDETHDGDNAPWDKAKPCFKLVWSRDPYCYNLLPHHVVARVLLLSRLQLHWCLGTLPRLIFNVWYLLDKWATGECHYVQVKWPGAPCYALPQFWCKSNLSPNCI